MTKACYKLFQENKNPSDADIEQAFKLQIQTNYLQKMQELVNLDGWDNFWNARHSIVCFYYHDYHVISFTNIFYIKIFFI